MKVQVVSMKRGPGQLFRLAKVCGSALLTMFPLIVLLSNPSSAAPASNLPASSSAATTSPEASAQAAPVVPLVENDQLVMGLGGSTGYSIVEPNVDGGWKTLAVLAVSGLDASSWTGYSCVTGTGNTIAATFAPDSFANIPDLRDHGAFAAVINRTSGKVSILSTRVSLQYHTPGCGLGDTVTFTSSPGDTESTTQIITVDGDGTVVSNNTVPGQVTSAVPVGDSTVAAIYDRLVSVDRSGAMSDLDRSSGTIYDVRPSLSGGVAYLSNAPSSQIALVHERSATGQTLDVASGPLHDLGIWYGKAGRNLLVGSPSTSNTPADLPVISEPAQPFAVSSEGHTIVGAVEPTSRKSGGSGDTLSSLDSLTVVASEGGQSATDVLDLPKMGLSSGVIDAGLTTTPPAARATALEVTTPTCSGPRLNPNLQVMQPDGAQVEWAADLAVNGQLLVSRKANYNNLGLAAYKPSKLFPLPGLDGGGGTIPAQVLLGILAQESNLSEASPHALPGVPGDPNIGDYYGTVYETNPAGFMLITDSNYSNADCGYGIGQLTAGMSAAGGANACGGTYTSAQQVAIAADYAANIAAAAQVLECMWNLTYSQGDTDNSASPAGIENWYDAIWAYNTGVHQVGDPGIPAGLYGLGWTNNPADDSYSPSRAPYLLLSYADAADPAGWPYQEKVLGWADHSQLDPSGNATYAPAAPLDLSTNYFMWCNPSINDCNSSPSDAGVGYCLNANRFYCLWHGNVTWVTRTTPAVVTYANGSAEPVAADPYPPSCTPTVDGGDPVDGNAPPSTAQIVLGVANESENIVGCGAAPSAGTFSMTTATAADGAPTGQIDLHQLGVGYGGHEWFAHTVNGAARPWMVDTGVWTAPSSATGWQRIWVHVPDNGADTYQANYQILLGAGDTTGHHRVVNQRWNANTWVDLGSFDLSAGADVSLSNSTYSDGANGDVDIAWDAIAFAPSSKPTVSYVAMGDSYSSGQGLQPFYANSDISQLGSDPTDACHRSPEAWPLSVYNSLKTSSPGATEFHFLACSGAEIDNIDPIDPNSAPNPSTEAEVPQALQGWLDENTTKVTIGVGGDDARFASILKGCMLTDAALGDCIDPNYHLTVNGSVDAEPLIDAEPTIISGEETYLTELLEDVHSLAPNAGIVLMGYPDVVTSWADLSGTECPLIDEADDVWFEEMDDQLDAVMSGAVLAANLTEVAYTDPKNLFVGHEACTDVNTEWINAVDGPSSSGSGSELIGDGSFHPNAGGEPTFASQALAAFPSATK